MRKIFNSILILLFVTFVFSSCAKKADDPTPQSTLIGKYMITAVTSTTGTVVTSIIRPCDLDDVIEFNGSGQAISDNGNLKCTATDPTIETDAYTIEADGKSMTIAGTKYFIELLDSTQLKLALVGTTSTVRITFTRR